MPTSVYGVPLHPLIVHATVVMIPLAALTVVLAALWPRFRSWAGPLPLGISAVGLVLVPLSTSTGETLERHVPRSALVEKHTELADGLLPWMIGLLVVSAIAYGLHWRARRGASVTKVVASVLAVAAIVVAAGTTVQVVRIGHAGAKASWSDTDMSALKGSAASS